MKGCAAKGQALPLFNSFITKGYSIVSCADQFSFGEATIEQAK
jgi:hypothetical protein